MIVALAWPINGETINLETVFFACAVVATVLVGRRTRVERYGENKRLVAEESHNVR